MHIGTATPDSNRVRPVGSPGRLIAVTGARGAPGRTEVALALGAAWAAYRSAVVDLDLAAPGLAVRTGMSPRPDLQDAAAALSATGRLPAGLLRPVAGTALVTGSHRPVAPRSARLVVEAVLRTVPVVIVDIGPAGAGHPVLARAHRIVVVADGSPSGVVRAARFLSGWSLRPPDLVANRVPPADREAVVRALRRWTGLEPSLVVPERRAIGLAARRAGSPDPSLVRLVSRLRPPHHRGDESGSV